MNCLLDTCTFLWMVDRVENLSPKVRDLLEDGSNLIVLSQISTLEIQIKYNRGKLPLGIPPREFVARAVAQFGLTYLELDDEHVFAKEKLPLLHRDPFDRLLIAQALHEGLVLLTPDPLIGPYPIRVIW